MNWTEADLARTLRQPGYRVVGAPGPPAALPVETPEGVLLAKIRATALKNGFIFYHTYRSTKSDPGFPDLFMTNGVSILMYELKTNEGKLTKEQAVWLSMLSHTGKVETGVWRPRDWSDIVARLERTTC